MRLGKAEKQIIQFLIDHDKQTSYTDILLQFAAWRRNAGERNGHKEWSVVEKRLRRLFEKGFIEVRNYGRSDARVILLKTLDGEGS